MAQYMQRIETTTDLIILLASGAYVSLLALGSTATIALALPHADAMGELYIQWNQ